LRYALITAFAVPIIACPCAPGLATPMSIILVGVGRGAQSGVPIRDAEALERMEKVDTRVPHKTGTLTEGRPKVAHIGPAHGFSAADVLQKLASVERAGEHPLALAIVNDAQEPKLALTVVTDFDAPVGKGVVGTGDGAHSVSGSGKFRAESGDAHPYWRRRQAGWLYGHRRPHQSDDTPVAGRAEGRWRSRRGAHRRRQDNGRRRGQATRH